MRVLWITNILFPEAIGLLLGHKVENNDSGGWLLGSADNLVANGISLVVASVSSLVKQLTRLEGERIVYYVLPCRKERKYHIKFEEMWREIVRRELPDFAHIHGTEFAHGLAFMKAGIGLKMILSIQGVMSAIGKYYSCGLSSREVYGNISVFDLLYSGSIFHQQKKIAKYARDIESEYFRKADIIIGRTSFDKESVFLINPQADYRVCNETLRAPFYEDDIWSYSCCKRHTLFLSQASYPLKGLHQVIRAVALLVNKFPDIQVRIAGRDFINNHGWKHLLIRSSYSKIITKMLDRYHLRKHFVFLGPLTARQMKNEYLSANVFVCASSIENSPNSLGEAQILGVPVIATQTGGIMDMISGIAMEFTYLYNDYFKLASLLERVFNQCFIHNSEMRIVALQRHDRNKNLSDLLSIYNSLIASR